MPGFPASAVAASYQIRIKPTTNRLVTMPDTHHACQVAHRHAPYRQLPPGGMVHAFLETT